ncbi:MAG TPA: hypothetical protein VF739_12125 [Ktedonobacterales bacterium]
MAEIEAIGDATDDEGADTLMPFAAHEAEATPAAPETPPIPDAAEGFAAPAAPETPDVTKVASGATEDGATEDDATRTQPTPRLTAPQQLQRALITLLAGTVSVALLSPFIAALVTAFVALLADGLSLADILWLLVHGELMQADIPLRALSVASRLGLMAIGYLGLCCALMTLLGGLLGRGRGRLFIIPGALLTASALALFATSVALAWPLLAPLDLSRAALLAIALYLTLATVALATLLADTRQTRRRWLRARTLVAAPRRRRDPEPSAPPPTLAGA